MKVALFGDIHGNAHALEAVLEDIEKQQADKMIVLGDLVFKGPLPELCVKRIQQLDTDVIQGNIDEMVGLNHIQDGFAKSPEHEADLRKEMDWTRARLSEEEIEYLVRLPFEYEEELTPHHSLFCVHANPHNLLDIVLPGSNEQALVTMFRQTEASIVAYGHIHQPFVRFIDGKVLLNTGSVGLPFDGDPRASYAILEVDEEQLNVSFRRIKYDVDAAADAFKGSGHPFADSVIAAIKAGRRPV